MLWSQKKVPLIPLPTTSPALIGKDALARHFPPGIKMRTNQDKSVSS